MSKPFKSLTGRVGGSLLFSRLSKWGRGLVWVSVLLVLPVWLARFSPASEARAEINNTWEQARETGGYEFSADIVQTTIPLATVANIGRTSKQQAFHVEGSTDFSDQTMQLALWSEGGNLTDTNSATQVKVEGNKAFAQRGDQSWQEISDFTGAFAPDGDFLGYLSAARNITRAGYESRAGITFTRYTFEVDGPMFAAFVRDQLERQLSEQGKLPPGINLDLPEAYTNMTGEGELWIRTDGLPLRQIITAHFPAQGKQDFRTDAEITVDFRFPNLGPTASGNFWVSGVVWVQNAFQTARDTVSNPPPGLLTSMMMTAILTALSALFIKFYRSRYTYAAVAIYMIVAMVVGPLLQTQQALAFFTEQKQIAAEQEQALETQLAQERAQEDLYAVNWDPHQNPLNANSLPASGEETTLLAACTTPTDTDADALTDCEETNLGTNPQNPDTDEDTLTDFQEVTGFSFGGQTWYSNPLEASTMRDGIGDSFRCAVTQFPNNCPDTDNDATPDMFDTDMDGDGVPNTVDLSPFRKSASTFSESNPLQLTINNLEANKYVYVEFQLRPNNAAHLWYAFNVLDWADGDRAGQIQRDDSYRDVAGNRIKTFFDACIQQGGTDCVMSPDDNGDIKLVPMLEIEIPNSSATLPSAQELQNYGVFARPGSDANKFAYVPLQLVTDNRTGARVAFYGKMVYKTPFSTGAWGGAHNARLVWVVQMLTDECKTSESGTCTSYSENGVDGHNQIIVAATYPDSYTVTGLNVRENRGTEYAIVYEDPAVDTNLNLDTGLIPASLGLDSTFLSNRDCDTTDATGACVGDGKPDITVNGRGVSAPTIADRLDYTRNGALPESARWGIPQMLRVTNHVYAHRDLAIVSVGSVEGTNILNTQFSPLWSVTQPFTPTLLYAYEDNFRALNDSPETNTAVPVGSENVKGMDWTGSSLTVNLRATVAQTTAGMNWSPYRYNGATWTAMEATDYLGELDARYANMALPSDSPESAEGKTAANQMYYMSLWAGASSLVKAGDTPIQDPSKFQTDPQQTASLKVGLTADALVVKHLVVKQLDLYLRVGSKEVFEYLGVLKGLQLKTNAIGQRGAIVGARQAAIKKAGIHPKWGSVGYGVAVVAVLVVINLSMAGVIDIPLPEINPPKPNLALDAAVNAAGGNTDDPTYQKALGITGQALTGAMLFYFLVYRTAKDVYQIYKTVRLSGQLPGALNRTTTILTANSELIGQTKWFRRAGLVIDLGITWGLALYQIFSAGLAPGSIGFNTIIANAVAATVVSILLFALGSTVIGTLIVALITFIDVFLQVLCKTGVGGACFGIVDSVTKALASYFYSVDSYVNFEHKDVNGQSDLVKINDLSMAMENPNNGLRAGNNLRYSASIVTTLYGRTDKVQASTFRYSLTTDPDAPYPSVGLNQMTGEWQSGFGLQATSNIISNPISLPAGLNRKASLYLKMAYAVKGYECYAAVYCEDRTLSGTNSIPLGEIVDFDIFPATLDNFYQMDWAGASSQICIDGDCRDVPALTFPAQRDHDGDGLSVELDPNDTLFDTDNDGLPDGRELEIGTQANNPDSDNDGLADGVEIMRGTNALNPDTDGDGLSDAEELGGRLFTYNTGKITRVFSDPVSTDTDGDGFSDLTEKNLSLNPTAIDPNPLVFSFETNDIDGILKPGATFVYTATLQNDLQPGALGRSGQIYASGNFATNLPTGLGLTNGGTQTAFSQSFLLPGNPAARTLDLQVQNVAPSGRVNITNGATATLYEGCCPPGGTLIGPLNNDGFLGLTIDNDLPLAEGSGPFYIQPGQTIILGGTSSDPTSYITAVEVSVDNGNWVTASFLPPQTKTGSEQAWAYAWTAPEEDGNHSFRVRATDAVGWVGNPSAPNPILVDGIAPNGTPTDPGNPVVRAAAGENGAFLVPLDGAATDDRAGIDFVEVLMSQNGAGWQRADLTPTADHTFGSWQMYYTLSGFDANNETRINPTGQYTYQIRVTDRAGNVSISAPYAIRIDQTAPVTTLDTPASLHTAPYIIHDPITIGGTAVETDTIQTGLASAEIAFTPRQVGNVLNNHLLLLGLDDPYAATRFGDDSGHGYDGSCATPGVCPTTGATGRFGDAVSFSGSQAIKIPAMNVPVDALTMGEWFNTTCPDCGLLSVQTTTGTDRQLYLSGGNVCTDLFNGNRETLCSAGANFADGQWHHALHVIGASGQALYVDGVLHATGTKTSSSFGATGDVFLGYAPNAAQPYLTGTLDQVQMFASTLTDLEARGVFQSWAMAPLQNSGNGVTSTSWSATVPKDLEGQFQIDLTATDILGNRNDLRSTWGLWQGEIDTKPPRVGITSYSYWNAGVPTTVVNAWAEDLNLTTDGLIFPCSFSNAGVNNALTLNYYPHAAPQGTLTQSYNTLTFPGETTQRLNRISLSCTITGLFSVAPIPQGFVPNGIALLACDVYGRCASQVPGQVNNIFLGKSAEMQKAPLPNGNPQTVIPESVRGNIAVDAANGYLYYASGNTVKRANLNGTNVVTLASGLTSPRDVNLDLRVGKMYWVETTRIVRANLDGSGIEVLKSGSAFTALAVDTTRGKMYWGDNGKLYGANLDVTGEKQLFSGHPVVGIAVHAETGLVFFVDSYQGPLAIYSMRLSVTDYNGGVTQLSSRDTRATGLIGVDSNAGYIYYGEQSQFLGNYIQKSSLELALFRRGLTNGAWLVEDSLLYYVGSSSNGSNTPTGVGLESYSVAPITLSDLEVTQTASASTIPYNAPLTFNVRVRNIGPSVAQDVIVTDTLPSGVTFVSAIPDRAGDTCSAPVSGVITCTLHDLTFGTTVNIPVIVNVNAGTTGSLTNTAQGTFNDTDGNPANNAASITVTAVAPTPTPTLTPTLTPTATRIPPTPTPSGLSKNIFWTDGNAKIQALETDNTLPRTIYDAGSNVWMSGLGIDPLTNKLYWIERTNGRIMSGNLDGTGAVPVITGLNTPTTLVVDGAGGRLYWRDSAGIQRANLDGTGAVTLVSAGYTTGMGFAVDLGRGYLYWSADGLIRRANLDGTGQTTLLSRLGFTIDSIALDLQTEYVYFTQTNTFIATLMQYPMFGGGGIPTSVSSSCTGGSSLSGLTVDNAGGKVYWLGCNAIWRADLAANSTAETFLATTISNVG
ncbi:MAG: hypothetical protein HUU38_08030, partial [Anaerolineales bacterium]|nr:hypothetical protein [Anaerolineales bacterium]